MSILYTLLAILVGTTTITLFWTSNLLLAIIGLLLTILGVSILAFLQGAAFIAVANVLLYSSGILLLLLSGAFILPLSPIAVSTHHQRPLGIAIVALVSMSLIPLINTVAVQLTQRGLAYTITVDTTTILGLQLMGPYTLAFEWVGIILLIALIGGLTLVPPPRRRS